MQDVRRTIVLPPPAHTVRPAPVWEYLKIVAAAKWRIAIAILLGLVATYALSLQMQPVYEAVATLEVDRDIPPGLVGSQSERRIFTGDDDVYIATQMKLIQSDAVLRPVAEKFGLPANGRRAAAPLSSAPIEWPQLKVSRQPNTHLIQIRYRAADPALAANVANAITEGFFEQSYTAKLSSSAKTTRYAEQQLREFKAKRDQSTEALSKFERELNLVNSQDKTNLVSARLLQLNNGYTEAQVARFAREAAYNSAKSENLDSAQASALSEPLRKLIERRNEAREKFSQTREHFGTKHPEYRRQAAQLTELDRQVEATRQSIVKRLEALYNESVDSERMLAASIAVTKAEADRLNLRSFDYEQLKREAETDQKVYEQLAQRVKETTINASFRNESIRAADTARVPDVPISPNLVLNLVAGFLLSTALSAGTVILLDKTNRTIRNRGHAESRLSLPVLGSLPVMPKPKRRRRLGSQTSIFHRDEQPVSAMLPVMERASGNLYAEALRSLNNTLMLRLDPAPMRSLLVTSAVASEGKTTISIHLAIVNALRTRRTLLIDGDVCRPTIHHVLDLANAAGVADFLGGDPHWRTAVVKHPTLPSLEVLPAGRVTAATLDTVGDRFGLLLDEAVKEYDLVIVDSPPMLCSAETLPMAAMSDRVLFVVSAGKTGQSDVQASLNMLVGARARVAGVALNGVSQDDCEIQLSGPSPDLVRRIVESIQRSHYV